MSRKAEEEAAVGAEQRGAPRPRTASDEANDALARALGGAPHVPDEPASWSPAGFGLREVREAATSDERSWMGFIFRFFFGK